MRRANMAMVAVAGLVLGMGSARADESADQAKSAIATAEVAVAEAQQAIEKGLKLVDAIESAELKAQVAQIIVATHGQWSSALKSLASAKQSQTMLAQAKSLEVARDYLHLAQINAHAAVSSATAVKVGLLFVEAAATGKVEAMGMIERSFQSASDAAKQMDVTCTKVKALIAEKYSKNKE